MKPFTVVLLLTCALMQAQAQYSINSQSIKAGVGYTHDFPGVNGYTATVEYAFPLLSGIQGGVGVKRADLTGYPRTTAIQEFTRASTIDLNLYWLALQTDHDLVRLGLGYSNSFYNVKRSYPLLVQDKGGASVIVYHPWHATGSTRGYNLIAEYEYLIPGSAVTLGLRAALYKAYTRTYFIGPMVGLHI